MVPAAAAPVGILAGRDSLPLEVADQVAAQGREVHLVGIAGEADPAIGRFPHTWVRWGQIGALLSAFREAGCRELVIIGAVQRPNLATIRPDAGFVRNLPLILSLMRGGDDSVLRRVARFFEQSGFVVRGAHEVAPGLLAGPGVIAGRDLSETEQRDVAIGLDLLAALGPADVGQAVVVSDGRPIAIEAAEGTDGMLKRLVRERGPNDGKPGGILIKAPKPGQELRIDLPTIGPRTLERAAVAGLSAIAVARGRVLVAARSRLGRLAEKHELALVGVEASESPSAADTSTAARSPEFELRQLGRVAPTDEHLADARWALNALKRAERFGARGSTVVARGHVLAMAADESDEVLLKRAGRLRQWGSRRRRGVVALRHEGSSDPKQIAADAAAAGVAGIVVADDKSDPAQRIALAAAADRRGLLLMREAGSRADGDGAGHPLNLFLVAGEHSGDALGAKLMAALRAKIGERVTFAGVGGEQMEAQGLRSQFPLSDVAVMGPLSILRRLPRIVSRVYSAVDAGLAADPDAVVIIDSPEFSHPIAKRIRRRHPDVPVIDYVCPQVWAWRSGRARKMRPYIDHILALLPFEPKALKNLGGPACTYVGHPLIERLEEFGTLDPAPLAARLRLDPTRPVLVVLPGSRSSEVGRLMAPFGETIAELALHGLSPEVIIPALPHVRPQVEAALAKWPRRPHVIESEEDKFRSFKLARAALAASGTVTLELALVGTPTAVAYRVDPLASRLRFLVKVPSVVLANLVLGENVYPEFIQEDCTPEKLAAALAPLLRRQSPEREKQLAGLSRISQKMRLEAGTPSDRAAEIVLEYARDRARRG